jgi:hypothetical protein
MTDIAMLPEPPVPAEVDLTDFPYMSLDVHRLLKSQTWIEAADNPKVGHALICLWCESWHQIPASSLPDSDRVLARFAMCDAETWAQIKGEVLRGWVKCADGLLYHTVVAEKALEAWGKKRQQRERTRAATNARNMRRRGEQRNVQRDDDVTDNVTESKGIEGNRIEGRGKGKTTTELDSKKATKREIVFESGYIRLTQRDLDQWANAFSSYPDIRAELTSIAAKLQDDPPAGFKPEKWFGTVAAWLKKGHERNLREGKTSPAAGDDAFAREATQWRARCRSHFERGKWQEQLWGPSPDSPGCMCPPAILAEFRKPNGRAAA